MIEISYILILIISVFFISKIFNSKNFLQSQSGEKHQKFVEKISVPLIGGFYFATAFLLIFYMTNQKILFLAVLSIFFLGIFSDLKIIKSPKIRFLFQILIILFFAYLFELKVVSTRIPFFDTFLSYKIINFFFVIFCILILVNGTNFIDGLNGLVIGYFALISIALYSIGFFDDFNFTKKEYLIFFSVLAVMFLFNISNRLYLGDSGTYTLGLVFSFIIIKYHENFPAISPYFIILLLWYPCFENLFSIMRKFKFKRSPMYPDENHLHQILFFFIKKKLDLSNIYINNLTSFIILLFNGIIFYIGSNHIYSTKLQIILIFAAILIYIFVYIVLFSYKYKTLKK